MNGPALGVLLLLSAGALSGCLTDAPGTTPLGGTRVGLSQDLTPPAAIRIPDVIRAIEPLAKADVPTGAGIAVYGHYAYVPAREQGFYVVDVSTPTAPKVVSHMERTTAFYVRYVDVLDQGGRIIVAAAGQGTGLHVLDVTDAAHPEILSTISFAADNQPSHNVVALPGTNLVYNTPSTGRGGTNHIVDLSDPTDPVIVGKFGDHGCHMTMVRMDLHRAYCAGIQESQIWDIADPRAPTLVSRIDFALIALDDVRETVGSVSVRGLHHVAMPNAKGDVLMVGDEFSGGGEPGACLANVPDPVTGSASTPVGALWFFDVTDEKNPKVLSWITPPTVPQLGASNLPKSCTAHLGSLVPDREQVLMAWYASGVVLIDFKNPSAPYVVTRWNDGTDTWTAVIYQGYIFTGDIARGLDVLKFV